MVASLPIHFELATFDEQPAMRQSVPTANNIVFIFFNWGFVFKLMQR